MKLREICNITMGQSPASSSYNDKGRGLAFFQGNADFGEKHPCVRVWCDAPEKIAQPGDILISVRAPVGAMNIAESVCCIGRGLAALTADAKMIDRNYLWYALQSRKNELDRKSTGSTFNKS